MIKLPSDAPGSAACGRGGLPLKAICPNAHTRLITFRFLKTAPDDSTPLYGRPFKCPTCASPDVTLFAVENDAELEVLHASLS